MPNRQKLKSGAKTILLQCYFMTVLVAALATLSTGTLAIGAIVNFIVANQGNASEFFDLYAGIDVRFFFTLVIITFAALLGGMAVQLFVYGPLEINCRRFFISIRSSAGSLGHLSFSFKNQYRNVVKVQLMRQFFILLWALLFIVPGVIKVYEYRLIPYLLAEDPGLDHRTARARSRTMMKGEKWNTFILDLSFIGWHVVGMFTFYLLNIFFVIPYQQLTNAELYHTLRTK